MQAVTGIGGIFFRARDPQALGQWYQQHLGVPLEPWGGAAFEWQTPANPQGAGTTIWSPFAADSNYYPQDKQFMINFRVADLDAMLAQLRAADCAVDEKVEDSEYGKFGWVTDPEGNKVELWQPPAGK
ncbi:VOC family protein [Massilia sp. W12]|uniref:VOC family protein n=1 Tax=Massilia sp. W12 TaxID=3126507 RepID=UPI0030CC9FA6